MFALCLIVTLQQVGNHQSCSRLRVSSPSYVPDDMQPLSDSLSAEYRSLVGIAMYMAQERFDIQYATKTMASSLRDPTWKAWLNL